MADSLSRPDRGNWQLSSSGSTRTQLYTLLVIDADAIESYTKPVDASALRSTNSDALAAVEFKFPMAPKSMSIDEPAAVQIVPTQNGGQFIEHQGQIYKNITVSGTTGLRPNRKAGGIIPVFDITISNGNGLASDERTGFDDLIDLRNLFRYYWDTKQTKRGANIIMVWENGKEGDWFIVEPGTIRTARDSSSPFTHTYEFPLRTIERLESSPFFKVTDGVKERNKFDNFMTRMNDTVLKLSAAFATASAFIDRTSAIGQAAVANVLNPVNTVINGLLGIITSGAKSLLVPQLVIGNIAKSATDIATSLAGDANIVYTAGSGVVTGAKEAERAYWDISRLCDSLFNESALFSTPVSTLVDWHSSISNLALDPNNQSQVLALNSPVNGGSPLESANINPTNSVSEATINFGEDIRGLAKRLLGDSARWKEIALINRLAAPYISIAGDGKSILRPGDIVLFPSVGLISATSSSAAVDTRTSGSSILAQTLGRDIRLIATETIGGSSAFDFAKNIRGDLDRIAEVDNLKQAVQIKFDTEIKELPTHPNFGSQVPIGSKALVRTLTRFKINVRTTLLTDSRIKTVNSVSTNYQDGILNAAVSADVVGANQSLTFDFVIN